MIFTLTGVNYWLQQLILQGIIPLTNSRPHSTENEALPEFHVVVEA